MNALLKVRLSVIGNCTESTTPSRYTPPPNRPAVRVGPFTSSASLPWLDASRAVTPLASLKEKAATGPFTCACACARMLLAPRALTPTTRPITRYRERRSHALTRRIEPALLNIKQSFGFRGGALHLVLIWLQHYYYYQDNNLAHIIGLSVQKLRSYISRSKFERFIQTTINTFVKDGRIYLTKSLNLISNCSERYLLLQLYVLSKIIVCKFKTFRRRKLRRI